MAIETGQIIEIKETKRAIEVFYFPKDKRIVSRVKTKLKHLLDGFKANDNVEIEFYNNYNEVERYNDDERMMKTKGFDNNWLEKIKHI